MSNAFSERRALVTGANRGIGFGTVVALLKLGAHVIAVSKSIDENEYRQRLSTAGVTSSNCTIIKADLSIAEECKRAAEQALPVDFLVNNAGIALNQPFLTADVESFDMTLRVNLRSCFIISQIIANDMIKRGARNCAIVNVSSQASKVALDMHTAYCVSKAGLDMLTKMMALELGQYQIRVNAVNPTVVLTDMGIQNWSDAHKAEPMLNKIPLHRFAEVDEVVEVIIFLLSPKASMINGVTLPVDGGFLATK